MNPTLRTILSVASALKVPAGQIVQRVEARWALRSPGVVQDG